MTSMNQELIVNIVGYAAALMGASMFLPQAVQLWKTKETKSISLLSFSFILSASVLWVVYGILVSALPIILVNTVIGITCVFIIYIKLRYK